MKIDTGIPLPTPTGTKYSFIDDMAVGDSVDVSDMTKPKQRQFYVAMQTAASRRGQGMRFSKLGTRIWRVK